MCLRPNKDDGDGGRGDVTGDIGDHQAKIRASWDANAAAWTEAVRQGAIASRRSGTDAAIVAAARRSSGRRLLDVGCGEGWLARALAPHGFAVTGIDGSAALVERAREAGGGRFEAMSYDAFIARPGAVGGPFDVAILNFALLSDDALPLLGALRECLVHGGVLLLQTLHPVEVSRGEPYVDGWRLETFASLPGFTHPMPWYFRTIGSWTDALRQAGFSVERIDEPIDPGSHRPLSLLLSAVRG